MGKKKRQNLPKTNIKDMDPLEYSVGPPMLIWPCFERSFAIEMEKSLYPYIEKDSEVFPGKKAVYDNIVCFKEAAEIKENSNDEYGISLGIRQFWETFCQSTTVLFADAHFNCRQYHRMIFELERMLSSKNTEHRMEISIYCRSNLKKLMEYDTKLRKIKSCIYANCDIRICALMDKEIIHDRFAIMDGEIWHCGAAIGGMHKALNAVSRGWRDDGDKLKHFLEQGGE